MSFTKDIAAHQREIAKKEEQEKQPQGPTLPEIAANNGESVLFGLYLESDNQQDLATKFFTGQLNEKESAELGEKRIEFLKVKENAKSLRGRMEQDFDGIIQASPDLKVTADSYGSAEIRKAFIDRIEEMAMRDPAWLEIMNTKFESLSKVEKTVDDGDKEITELCKENGFTEEEYKTAIKHRKQDPFAFEDLLKSKMGTFKKIFTGYRTFLKQVDEIDKRKEIDKQIAALNLEFKEIGGFVQSTLFTDKTTHEVLMNNFRGEQAPSVGTSFSEARGFAKSLDYGDLQNKWNNIKKEHEKDEGFDVDAAYANFAKDSFEKPFSKKPGFWATIFRSFMGTQAKRRIKK